MTARLLFALALCLPFGVRAGDVPTDPAKMVRQAIQRDWSVRDERTGGYVVVTSPIYPMAFGRGCILHKLFFLDGPEGPSMARMVAEDRYYTFAGGEACAAIEPARFFGIEPGNDVEGLLDLAGRIKAGPQAGRDSFGRDAQARVAACFTPEAMASTRVTRAVSRRVGGVRGEEYRVALECASLRDGEELHATSSRKDASVHWDIGTLTTVVPASDD